MQMSRAVGHPQLVAVLGLPLARVVRRPGEPDALPGRHGHGVAAQVDRAVTDGAVLVSEGERNGAFFPPGVLTNVATSSPSYKEELFGPVATVYKVDSEDEAVELANDTPFGLGSYVFTTDLAQAERVADKIDAGMVFVNVVGADGVELPFGGIKRSGFGRELGSFGIDEFVNKKLLRFG